LIPTLLPIIAQLFDPYSTMFTGYRSQADIKDDLIKRLANCKLQAAPTASRPPRIEDLVKGTVASTQNWQLTTREALLAPVQKFEASRTAMKELLEGNARDLAARVNAVVSAVSTGLNSIAALTNAKPPHDRLDAKRIETDLLTAISNATQSFDALMNSKPDSYGQSALAFESRIDDLIRVFNTNRTTLAALGKSLSHYPTMIDSIGGSVTKLLGSCTEAVKSLSSLRRSLFNSVKTQIVWMPSLDLPPADFSFGTIQKIQAVAITLTLPDGELKLAAFDSLKSCGLHQIDFRKLFEWFGNLIPTLLPIIAHLFDTYSVMFTEYRSADSIKADLNNRLSACVLSDPPKLKSPVSALTTIVSTTQSELVKWKCETMPPILKQQVENFTNGRQTIESSIAKYTNAARDAENSFCTTFVSLLKEIAGLLANGRLSAEIPADSFFQGLNASIGETVKHLAMIMSRDNPDAAVSELVGFRTKLVASITTGRDRFGQVDQLFSSYLATLSTTTGKMTAISETSSKVLTQLAGLRGGLVTQLAAVRWLATGICPQEEERNIQKTEFKLPSVKVALGDSEDLNGIEEAGRSILEKRRELERTVGDRDNTIESKTRDVSKLQNELAKMTRDMTTIGGERDRFKKMAENLRNGRSEELVLLRRRTEAKFLKAAEIHRREFEAFLADS
jgi:hypothetical protein